MVIDHRLSTSDPTDLSGFPSIVNGVATFIPFEMFPLEGQELPEGKDGWVLFLDELSSAPMSVQSAAYKLALDREVGQHKLHPNVHIVCAGNRRGDGAIANNLGTAMQSRLVHLEVDVNADDWLSWAYSKDLDSRITSYIAYSPDKLYMFDPNHNDKTFPCPRTWHFLSRYADANDMSAEDLPIIAGTIGEGPARQFLQFCEVGKDLPGFSEILKNPTATPVPEDPATVYFLCGTLASKADAKNIEKVMEYVVRLPIEFQIVCLRDMRKRNMELAKLPAIRQWIQNTAREQLSDQ